MVTCWCAGTPLGSFLDVDMLGKAWVFALEPSDSSAPDAPCASNGEPLLILKMGTGIDLNIRGRIAWVTTKPDGTPKKQVDRSGPAALGSPTELLVGTVAGFQEQLGENLMR